MPTWFPSPTTPAQLKKSLGDPTLVTNPYLPVHNAVLIDRWDTDYTVPGFVAYEISLEVIPGVRPNIITPRTYRNEPHWSFEPLPSYLCKTRQRGQRLYRPPGIVRLWH